MTNFFLYLGFTQDYRPNKSKTPAMKTGALG